MDSDISLHRLKQFPHLMWILLFGSFITRGSYYMVWPFLSVILYKKFDISATEVGMILTSAAVISVLVGFVASTLSDWFGRKTIMYLSGVVYIAAFCALANANSVLGYAIVITFCSIATEVWRPACSALIGDIIKEKQTRELAMQSQYFMVNVGSAIGPVLGFWLGLSATSESFYITAVAFAILLMLLVFGFRGQDKVVNNKQATEVKAHSLQGNNRGLLITLKVLAQDRLLQCLILANIFCMFIYGQMDSTLIQYLTRAQVPELLKLVSSLIFTNSLVIITSQFLLLKLMAKLALVQRIQIGLALLTVSQLIMALIPAAYFVGWITAVIIMSLAEAILFPTMNVHIDRLAPENMRGAYFGATAFYSFGFAFAPLGGGLLLDYLGGSGVYFTATLLAVVVIYLYSLLDKLKRPTAVVA